MATITLLNNNMQTIEYNKETKKITLYNGPYLNDCNIIKIMDNIERIVANGSYYEAVGDNGAKLRVPVKKTNIIF
jgi:hypothetical protein